MNTGTSRSNSSPSDAETPSVQPPKNPAKGNQRGQTTLAARIARIEVLVDNLAPHIDETPALKDQYTQLQSMLASAKSLRNRLKTLRAQTVEAMNQRNEMLAGGEDLFERVRHGLLSFHGPTSERLLEFGLKPRLPGRAGPRSSPRRTRLRSRWRRTRPSSRNRSHPESVVS